MSWLIGWIWWLAIPIRKRLAVSNFKAAFPSLPSTLLRRTVGEMVWGYVELAMGRRAVVHGAELIEGGGICLAGHFGAWDLALVSAGERIPITIFVKTPTNRFAARWIHAIRSKAGIELLGPSNSSLAAYRAVQAGRLLIFVQDQRHNKGVATPFFGRPALTSRGFGVLADRTKAPLFGATQWRDERGQHHVQFKPLDVDIPASTDEAISVLTNESQRFYEQTIKIRPHSWLWLHDRWRSY